MVALVCGWHGDHPSTTEEVNRRLSRGEELVVAAPALVETYSVLTRLPSPHRLSPRDALSLLDANFMSGVEITSLSGRVYRALLSRAPALQIQGGRIYDAVIFECAVEAGAAALLTLNGSHFRSWQSEQLKIVVPGIAP
jgi:predicted nucleic acid-binding protein